jgi:tRNA(Ile)-lysidine synthase
MYIVAVSGGVDSVVLLHVMMQKYDNSHFTIHNSQKIPKSQFPIPNSSPAPTYHLPPTTYQFIVAHFDHGIRPDSADDRRFVQKLAEQYGLPFEYETVELGAGVSEAVARKARYDFLRRVKDKHAADAIVTAHHQDDMLETIIINWLRGTKSRGLSSLRSTPEISRPLLGWSKQQIRAYAHLHKLTWHEDSTNADETYLRNHVRRVIMPRLGQAERQKLLTHSEKAATLNDAIQTMVAQYLQQHTSKKTIDRDSFKALPDEVAREVLAEWLRLHTPAVITTKLLRRLVHAIQTGRNTSRADIEQGYSLAIARNTVQLILPHVSDPN